MSGRFFLLAIGFTWAAWIPAALLSSHGPAALLQALLYLGGAGPLLALAISLRANSQLRRGYFARLRRLRPLYSLAMGLALILPFAASLFGLVASTEAELPSPAGLLPLALPLLLFGPLPEELAWRAHGLPMLLRQHPALSASLILATVWSVWHLPLFFMAGTYQAELSSGETGLFVVNLYSQSIIMTALFLASGSPWTAVAFHWTTNLSGEWLDLTATGEVYRSAATLVVALLVLALPRPWGLRGL